MSFETKLCIFLNLFKVWLKNKNIQLRSGIEIIYKEVAEADPQDSEYPTEFVRDSFCRFIL